MQAANFEEGASDSKEDNADDALVRFEFHEILVRIAFSKYLITREMNDASDAVARLLDECVLPYVNAKALVDPNEFRFRRLYNEASEVVLAAHNDFLLSLFKVLLPPLRLGAVASLLCTFCGASPSP